MLVGEAPGSREVSLGQPFVGDAGYQLSRTLERTAYCRSDFRIDNVVKCRPPKNWLEGAPWEHGAVACCDQYLRSEVRRIKPKVVVAMGNIALRSFTGRKGIYELMMADDAVGAMVLKNVDAQTIKRVAQAQGMDSLRDDGARKVFEGRTTVEEVVAATQEDVDE